jgi:hypothetical protein
MILVLLAVWLLLSRIFVVVLRKPAEPTPLAAADLAVEVKK